MGEVRYGEPPTFMPHNIYKVLGINHVVTNTLLHGWCWGTSGQARALPCLVHAHVRAGKCIACSATHLPCKVHCSVPILPCPLQSRKLLGRKHRKASRGQVMRCDEPLVGWLAAVQRRLAQRPGCAASGSTASQDPHHASAPCSHPSCSAAAGAKPQSESGKSARSNASKIHIMPSFASSLLSTCGRAGAWQHEQHGSTEAWTTWQHRQHDNIRSMAAWQHGSTEA